MYSVSWDEGQWMRRKPFRVYSLTERLVMPEETRYVVQVWNGKRWAKVRGHEGGPWNTRDRAERIAQGRERSERRESSTEGMPHRVVEVNN